MEMLINAILKSMGYERGQFDALLKNYAVQFELFKANAENALERIKHLEAQNARLIEMVSSLPGVDVGAHRQQDLTHVKQLTAHLQNAPTLEQ